MTLTLQKQLFNLSGGKNVFGLSSYHLREIGTFLAYLNTLLTAATHRDWLSSVFLGGSSFELV